jgi:hypothetical protein
MMDRVITGRDVGIASRARTRARAAAEPVPVHVQQRDAAGRDTPPPTAVATGNCSRGLHRRALSLGSTRGPERDSYSAAVSRIAHLQASSPHSHRKELIPPSVAGLPRASAVDSLSSHERACVSDSRSRQLAIAVTVAAAVAVDGRA